MAASRNCLRTTQLPQFPDNVIDEVGTLRSDPTTIATCYAARLFYRDGQVKQIVPGPTQGLGAYVWVSGNPWRNWLTVSDLSEVTHLLARYDFEKLPKHIRKALRHFLYACFTYELEIRFTLVVTALEALVNTHKRDVTKQFKRRLHLAGTDLGVSVIEEEAKEAYDYRSNFVHGQFLQGQEVLQDCLLLSRLVHLCPLGDRWLVPEYLVRNAHIRCRGLENHIAHEVLTCIDRHLSSSLVRCNPKSSYEYS